MVGKEGDFLSRRGRSSATSAKKARQRLLRFPNREQERSQSKYNNDDQDNIERCPGKLVILHICNSVLQE